MPSIVPTDELARLASSTSSSSPRQSTRIVASISASPCMSPSPGALAFSSTAQGHALSPPPPTHYLRNKRCDFPEEKLDLIRKRSEIYTRVKRLSPAATTGSANWPIGDDVDEGLLFGKEFHSAWSPYAHHEAETDQKLILDLSDEPATKRACSPAPSQLSSIHSTSKENEESTASSGQVAHATRQPRLPLKLMLRERLSITTRSKSVDSPLFVASESITQNDSKVLQNSNSSIRTFSSSSSTTPDSPVSNFNTYQEGIYIDVKRQKQSKTVHTKPLPPVPVMLQTPPSSWSGQHQLSNSSNTPPQSPPPSTASLLDAQKLRRARAIDQFTRYSDALPYKRPDTPQSAREFAVPSDTGCGPVSDSWSLRRTSSIPYGVENVRRRSATTSGAGDFTAQLASPSHSDFSSTNGSPLNQGSGHHRSSWLSSAKSPAPMIQRSLTTNEVVKPTHRKARTLGAGLKSLLSSRSS